MANYVARSFDEIKTTAHFWAAHPEVPVAGKTPSDLSGLVATIEELNRQIDAIDKQRRELDGRRDRLFSAAQELKGRVRKSAVGAYGPDSPLLRTLGLKPASEKKRPARKRA